MNNKPEYSDYSLTNEIVEKVNNTNRITEEKEKKLKKIVLILFLAISYSITILVFFFISEGKLLWLIPTAIISIYLNHLYQTSDLLYSSIQTYKEDYLRRTGITRNNFNNWESNYILYKCAMSTFKERQAIIEWDLNKLKEEEKLKKIKSETIPSLPKSQEEIPHNITHADESMQKESPYEENQDLKITENRSTIINEEKIEHETFTDSDSVSDELPQLLIEEKSIESVLPLSETELKSNELARQNIGQLGELYILELEKRILTEMNRKDLAEKIEHISMTKGDGLGYDILSFTTNGDEKYIEVKTTTGKAENPFYITENELQTLSNVENYFIYRVYNFNKKHHTADVDYIETKGKIEDTFIVEPIEFKVTPNKKLST